MWPKLFELRLEGLHLGLPTYGAFVALGFTAGTWLAGRSARRQGLPEREVVDLAFWLLVAGMIGSRLLYLAIHADEYLRDCVEPSGRGAWRAIVECTRALQIWEGGLVFYGGVLAAIPTAWWLARQRALPFFRLADLLAPSVAIAHFFGRLGCFAAGCCFGRVCDLPFGARFPAASNPFSELAMRGEVSWAAAATPPLHPTQLYEAFGELAIFAGLSWLAMRKRFDGQILLVYAASYAALRTVVETFRGDAGRGHLGPLSTSQWVSAATFAAAALLWLRLRRRGSPSG